MSKEINDILELLNKHNAQVIVDNDFDNAYSIPFEAFKETKKNHLIETLFILVSIMRENELDIDQILDRSEY